MELLAGSERLVAFYDQVHVGDCKGSSASLLSAIWVVQFNVCNKLLSRTSRPLPEAMQMFAGQELLWDHYAGVAACMHASMQPCIRSGRLRRHACLCPS